MKKNKRNFASFALFIHGIGVTNNRDFRISIKQSNINKQCIKEFDYRYNFIGSQVESYLNQIDEVVSYNYIINNTSFDNYIINIETLKNKPLPDLIEKIKNL